MIGTVSGDFFLKRRKVSRPLFFNWGPRTVKGCVDRGEKG